MFEFTNPGHIQGTKHSKRAVFCEPHADNSLYNLGSIPDVQDFGYH